MPARLIFNSLLAKWHLTKWQVEKMTWQQEFSQIER
jgi:hypothetical protein